MKTILFTSLFLLGANGFAAQVECDVISLSPQKLDCHVVGSSSQSGEVTRQMGTFGRTQGEAAFNLAKLCEDTGKENHLRFKGLDIELATRQNSNQVFAFGKCLFETD